MKPSNIALLVVAVLVVAAAAWVLGTPRTGSPNIVARAGLHWHPQLFIYVDGALVEIPQNVGLGAVHQPMHTHEDPPVIHLEFGGVVRSSDLTLGRFFGVWEKDIHSFGPNMRMVVNGQENTEFESYVMRDGDKIELYYD